MGNVTSKLSDTIRTWRIRKRPRKGSSQNTRDVPTVKNLRKKSQIAKQTDPAENPPSKKSSRVAKPPRRKTVLEAQRSVRINEWLQTVDTKHENSQQSPREEDDLMMMIVYKNRGEQKVRLMPARNTS